MAALELNIDELLPFELDKGSTPPEMPEKAVSHGEDLPKKIFPPDPEKYQSSRTGLAFVVLRDYLQPDSTMRLKDAVSRIIDVWPSDCVDMRELNDLWFELGRQIPYNHPSHIKLARAVEGVGTSEKRIQKQYYDHLSIDLRDNFGDPDGEEMSLAQWVKYQAFQANLGAPLSCLNFGVWNLRDTFEKDHEKEDIALQESRIMGTAQWILWCGQDLFKELLVPDEWWGLPTSDESAREKEDRFRLEKANRLTLKRWQNAKAGFEKAVGSRRFGKECRDIAEKAAETMDIIERGMILR